MTRGRRRPARANVKKSDEHSQSSTRSTTPLDAIQVETGPSHSNNDSCPACKDHSADVLNTLNKVNWIECEFCKTWYHWSCAGNGEDVGTIDKWYCKPCLEADPTRTITLKPPARKSSRKRTQRDYANLNSGRESDPNRWLRMLEGKSIKPDPFKRMVGSAVGLEWLEEDEDAMREPIVIESPEGLGMKMPPNDFTVDDVAELVGEDVPVEVIDVATQSTSPGWSLSKWAEYFNLEAGARERTYNVISLEVSSTKLSDMILPPRLVRELDWVENFWPSTRKGKGHVYPKVQLYCLMGVSTAWTDWHVDFAGSSVYYHILRGSKVFYFIRPTPANLAAYERWSGTELQTHSWLGDMVDEVFKVELTQGNTMVIPTGWIHAVYTPVDTLVFGGNFLHSYNVTTQLRIRKIEIATQVPKKFRFPMFSKLCWYVGDRYLRDLKSPAGVEFSSRVLSSILALADFLVSESRLLERGNDQVKKEINDQIPSDRVKDAPAMARELRWRIRLAAGYSSDEEGSKVTRKGKELTNGHAANVNKRKRVESASPIIDDERPKFKNFRPRSWDNVKEETMNSETIVLKRKRPGEDDNWKEQWVEWGDNTNTNGEGDEAEVNRQREVVVRVRKTPKGLERQQMQRVVEVWTWNNVE